MNKLGKFVVIGISVGFAVGAYVVTSKVLESKFEDQPVDNKKNLIDLGIIGISGLVASNVGAYTYNLMETTVKILSKAKEVVPAL